MIPATIFPIELSKLTQAVTLELFLGGDWLKSQVGHFPDMVFCGSPWSQCWDSTLN
jgi:hypothetical protein